MYRYLFKLTLVVLLLPCCLAGEEPTTEQLKFFETRIRPLLVERCYECHSGDVDEVESKFQIDSRAGILRGGIHGPAAIPGMPEKSLLIFAVNHAVQIDMPPKFKLPTREIADLTAWVKMGLPWPDSEATAAIPKPGQETAQEITDEDRQFWSFLPPRLPDLP
ncbi:MAG: c-type cytochrome domain-containing protein, partial [Pirellulaceae bacterium]